VRRPDDKEGGILAGSNVDSAAKISFAVEADSKRLTRRVHEAFQSR
jgi:hypothetical protein